MKASFAMTTYDSIFSRRIIPILRLASVLILAGCAFWFELPVPVHHSKAIATANPLPNLRGTEAVEHLKQEGLYASLAEALAAARYNAEPLPSPHSYKFSNPAHDLRAAFTSSGARVMSSKGGREPELVIKPIGYGYGSRITGLDSQKIVARGNRIEHEYSIRESAIRNPQSAIKEWFINSEAGIEHGFTLAEPPPSARGMGDELRVEMEIGGDFEARLDAAGQAVTLDCACGGGPLTYDKLRVYDARNREVAARFELEGKRLAIVVEDGEAEYPLTIDPLITRRRRLTASDGAANGQFGRSCAISGDTAVVGAFNEVSGQGAAYVFVRNRGNWTQQAKLTASDGAPNDLFGSSCAISGDTAVVGASLADVDGNANQGKAYAFRRSGTAWTQEAILTSSDGAAEDQFGGSVAIDADTAVAGAPLADVDGKANQGKAYAFRRSGMTWTQEAMLTSSDGAAEDEFGFSVGIDGDTAVCGARSADVDGKANQGKAYAFGRSGTTWTQQATLMASDGAAGDQFGSSVGIDEDTAVAGAPGDDSSRGASYVFTRDGGTWPQQQKLTATDGAAGDRFGESVSIDREMTVAGAREANSGRGAAYAYGRRMKQWKQKQKLTAPDGAPNDDFGASASIDGDTIVSGAPGDQVGANAAQGAADVFTICDNLAQQQKLTAGDGATNDQFGASVAASGDTVVVGAPLDDVNGTTNQGSAYVFTQSGTAWALQQKLTASDGAAGDQFGASVAIDGDTVVVGAHSADVDGKANQGKAYAFGRSGTTWTQQSLLTSSDGAAGDQFGASVSVSGDTAVVGSDFADVGGRADQGKAYAFGRSGVTWTQQAILTSSDGAAGDQFGASCAIDGNTAAVGARLADVAGKANQGKAYAFGRSGIIWMQQAILTASDGAAGDRFGEAIAIDGDTIAVGADGDNIGANLEQGSAYVFARSGTAWSQQAKLTASDGAFGDSFGSSIAIDGDTVLAGSDFADVGGRANQGAAYAFGREGTIWTQQQKLTASDGAAGDRFGVSVAIDGNTVVAGAFGDDLSRGSAYVFGCPELDPDIALDPSNPILPPAQAGVPYSQTFTASGGDPPFNFSIVEGDLPQGLALSSTGELSGVPTESGSFDFAVGATDSDFSQGSQDNTLVVAPPPPGIITVNPPNPTLPPAEEGEPYSLAFTASGGTPPHTFNVTAGATPPGLTLSPAGVLSGVPASEGAFSFTVTATDANGFQGSRAYTLAVREDDDSHTARNVALISAAGVAGLLAARQIWDDGPTGARLRCPTINVIPASLPVCVVGQPYSTKFGASDGTSPHNFIVKGALPPGLTLDSGGNLSGTPGAAGSYTFSVAATDARNCNAERAYTLVVNSSSTSSAGNPDALGAGSALAINPETLLAGTAGRAYNQTLSASGGTAPFGFSLTGGSLPAGLTLAASGSISGTPAAAGTFNFTASVTDRNGHTSARDYAITVKPPCSALTLTPASLPNGEVGETYNQILGAGGGTDPFSFSLGAGALPVGLLLDHATGSISGKPGLSATSDFTISVTDSNGCAGAIAYKVSIAPGRFRTVSAASNTPLAAPKEVVAGFGSGLTDKTVSANSPPLPTYLDGMRVVVKDSAGVERAAPLLLISPMMISYQIPDGAAPGAATVSVFKGEELVAAGVAQIVRPRPPSAPKTRAAWRRRRAP
jgi:hypothetical protein